MRIKTISKATKKILTISQWYKPELYDIHYCNILVPVLNLNFVLCFCTVDEFKRYIEEIAGRTLEAPADVPAEYISYDADGVSHRFIVISRNQWLAGDYGILAHELHHAAHCGLKDIGVSYTDSSEEVFAYVQGFLMEQVISAFIELEKKIEVNNQLP